MKRSGAWLTRYALETIGVTHTFGIPGEHNTEIYHELDQSEQITPYIVTHEASAAFMADAVSRTTDTIGTLIIVPASGVTHAASGIAEAFLDGIPMLIITGCVDNEYGHHYQHQAIDLPTLVAPITKASFRVKSLDDLVSTIFEAYRTALDGVPGPVFIEIPINLQLSHEETGELPTFKPTPIKPVIDDAAIAQAAQMLIQAEHPGIFVGWGAKEATDIIQSLASHLGAPVATTLQGLSVFPANHPLHTGMGFGQSAVPAVQHAFENCDCLLAVATCFSETSTGNLSVTPPENLIHLDIDSNVFNAHFPAALSLQGDATNLLVTLLKKVLELQATPKESKELAQQIAADKQSYQSLWRKHKTDRVNPANFFDALRKRLPEKTLVACDDGNHTMLAAELLPIYQTGGFICPTGFNAMGYCIPAANALKLSHPSHTVVGIVGNGAMLMSGMETITANKYGLGVIYFLFNDEELGKIAPPEEIPNKRMTGTKQGEADWISFSQAMGCEYVAIEDDSQLQPGLDSAFRLTLQDKPVLVDVYIDYSKHSAFMDGALKTKYRRANRTTKARYLARALTRKLIGSK
ncbi:MAG: thiamine pyrophosphate-binding protein [Porticoccus sp.]|nr:thiamine pyrophosphate-binding protein [Porticoccus sp.]